VSWGNTFTFCFHLFLRTFQQPNPFCCNRSTTNLFMISFLSRTIDFFFLSLWIYLWLAETSQQPISQTTWLKVTPHCNHCNHWGISAGSDCVHTIWEWSLANGMVVLAFVINVSVEKFKMRSMCFSFASVLKCASCAWDTVTFLKECLRLCVCLLLQALNLFLS